MNEMRDDDDQLVAFLRRFRPRSAPPLRMERPVRARLSMGTAAVVLVGVMGATLWLAYRPETNLDRGPGAADGNDRSDVRRPEIMRLGQAARAVEWDATRLDELLTNLAPDVLPQIERPDSTLGVLAKP